MAWDDLIEKVTVEECHEGSEGMNCMMLGRRTFTQRHDECLVSQWKQGEHKNE